MQWKEAAVQLGTSTLVSGLKALKGTMKNRDFKRLVSTTAAQVLAVHPDLKGRKARRWVRKATGTRPGKVTMKSAKRGAKQAAEAVAAAAVARGAAKAVGKIKDSPEVKRRMRAIRDKVEETAGGDGKEESRL
jgi:hypothetical protein